MDEDYKRHCTVFKKISTSLELTNHCYIVLKYNFNFFFIWSKLRSLVVIYKFSLFNCFIDVYVIDILENSTYFFCYVIYIKATCMTF